MSCTEFWNEAPELELEKSAGHPHLSECPACAAIFTRQRRLADGLRAMALDSRETGAPARVEARLFAAFRAAQVPAVRPRPALWRVRPMWALAAAAALLIGAGVWFMPREKNTPAANHRQPAKVEMASIEDPGNSDTPAFEEGFIPLPNAQRLEPGDDVNVVRVELPRSAMTAVGYDVSADRAAELVEADVALGPDGLARAVRFVEASSL